MAEDNTGRSEKRRINRRNVLRGAAAASLTGVGLLGLPGSAAAETEPITHDRARSTFETHAADVLDTLSDEGLLADATAGSLPTGATARSRSDEGVARAVVDDTEFYVARGRTDRGHLTLLTKPEADESLAVLSTDDGFEVYGPDGPEELSTQCACGGDYCGLGSYFLYCGGFPVYCC